MPEKITTLTKEGKAELEERLNRLTNIERPAIMDELNFARSQGDLSENADYDAAKAKQEKINGEIEQIKYVLDHCRIVEKIDSETEKKANIGGGNITVREVETGKERTFKIVGAIEADPKSGKISNTCPVAQAVIGHAAGDTVTVHAKKEYDLEIVTID